MKKIVCSIAIVICGIDVFSQGAWDVKHISLEALDGSFIGKKIRVDFKASDVDTADGEVKALSIRKLLSTKDTVRVNINNKPLKFIE